MLDKLAADIRFMQLYAHNAHNMVKGPTFMQDHEFLGDLYAGYEGIYDSIIERIMGLGMSVDLIEVQTIAVKTLQNAPVESDPKAIFQSILAYEKYICSEIPKMLQGMTEGTRQFLGNIADQSEMRQYKLQQRIK